METAATYLDENYYGDLLRRLQAELGRAGRFFLTKKLATDTELVGVGVSIEAGINCIQKQVLPCFQEQLSDRVKDFRAAAGVGAREVEQHQASAWERSDLGLDVKRSKWLSLAYNSLRKLGQEKGVHDPPRVGHMDVNEDISRVFLDDLIGSWRSYREHFIRSRVDTATRDLSKELGERLRTTVAGGDPAAQKILDGAVAQMVEAAEDARKALIDQTRKKIEQLASIRKPAYEFIQNALLRPYAQVGAEGGTGCKGRMERHLKSGLEQNLNEIKDFIAGRVHNNIQELLEECARAVEKFGAACREAVEATVQGMRRVGQLEERAVLQSRLGVIEAVLALPPFRSRAAEVP